MGNEPRADALTAIWASDLYPTDPLAAIGKYCRHAHRFPETPADRNVVRGRMPSDPLPAPTTVTAMLNVRRLRRPAGRISVRPVQMLECGPAAGLRREGITQPDTPGEPGWMQQYAEHLGQ